MRRWILSLAAAGTLALLQAVNVFASLEWCGEDPPVDVVTPAGHSVTVNVTDYVLGRNHIPQLSKAEIRYSVAPSEQGGVAGTRVTMHDTIPTGDGDNFPTAADVNYQGVMLVRTSGHSDQSMRLSFFIPVE